MDTSSSHFTPLVPGTKHKICGTSTQMIKEKHPLANILVGIQINSYENYFKSHSQ